MISHWRSAKNQGAQSTKAGLRAEYFENCVSEDVAEPWALGLDENPVWMSRPEAAAKIVQIRKDAAIQITQVGVDTLRAMEREYEASAESNMEVTQATVTRLEGAYISEEKMAKVRRFVNEKIDTEHKEELAILLKRMDTMKKRSPTDIQILEPMKHLRDQNKKAAAAAQAEAAARAEEKKKKAEQDFQAGPLGGADREVVKGATGEAEATEAEERKGRSGPWPTATATATTATGQGPSSDSGPSVDPSSVIDLDLDKKENVETEVNILSNHVSNIKISEYYPEVVSDLPKNIVNISNKKVKSK